MCFSEHLVFKDPPIALVICHEGISDDRRRLRDRVEQGQADRPDEFALMRRNAKLERLHVAVFGPRDMLLIIVTYDRNR